MSTAPSAGFVSSGRFAAEAKRVGAAIPPGVIKGFTVECDEVSETDRTVRFTISTAAPDHEGDRVSASGWNLDVYRRNPVVLFAHDYKSLPLAKAVEITVDGDRLRSRAQFATRDLNPVGDRVLRLIRAGFLNAASVGFVPTKWQWRDATDELPAGMDYQAQTLVEWSVVPVPAHPEALVEGRSLGEAVAWIDEWAAKHLELTGRVALPAAEVAELKRLAADGGSAVLLAENETLKRQVANLEYTLRVRTAQAAIFAK